MTNSNQKKGLRFFVTREDLDGGAIQASETAPVGVEPHPDHMTILADTYRRLEDQATEQAQKEVAESVDGVEEVKSAVDEANETEGGVSVESVAFIALALKSYHRRLGMENAAQMASLESVVQSGKKRVRLSTESMSISMEGEDSGFAKTVLKRFASNFVRAYKPSWVLVKLAGVGISGIIEKASRVKASSKATIVIPANRLALGDRISKNPAADMERTAKFLNVIMGPFAKQAKVDHISNSELIEKAWAVTDSFDEAVEAMRKCQSQWKDTRNLLPGNPSDPLLGGYSLFKDQSLKYTGNNPSAKHFDEIANKGYPMLTLWQSADGLARHEAGTVTIPALTPREIVEIGKLLSEAVSNYGLFMVAWEKISSFFSMAAVPAAALAVAAGGPISFIVFGSIFMTKLINRNSGSDAASNPGAALGVTSEIRTLYDAFLTSSRLCFHVPTDAEKALRKAISIYKLLAKASIKAHLSAATESFQEAAPTDRRPAGTKSEFLFEVVK